VKIKIYQVDAFASKVFEGNPAAVCPLDEWLNDETLQKIAEENNLSETAFFVTSAQGIELRWFTPMEEVDLCGHATLAAAHVLYEHLNFDSPVIKFQTRSGELEVSKNGSGFSMNFPASYPEVVDAPSNLLEGLGNITPKHVMASFDYVVVLNNEKEVMNIKPDFTKWLKLDLRGVVVTAPGTDVDFVSRCFFPKLRVNEDPITGSAHCELTPYWSSELNLSMLTGRQISNRSGILHCGEINI